MAEKRSVFESDFGESRSEDAIIHHIPERLVVITHQVGKARIADGHMFHHLAQGVHLVPGVELRAEALVYLFHDAGEAVEFLLGRGAGIALDGGVAFF